MSRRALIIVDPQNDFCPGGRLAVEGGDNIFKAINDLAHLTDRHGGIVVATQDWHPAVHGSFAVVSNQPLFSTFDLNGLPQVAWPEHCVQGTRGAEFHESLDVRPIRAIFRKGMDSTVDSYSGFADNGQRNDTGLDAYLRSQGVTEVVVVGLATDYCVKFTAIGAFTRGFKVTVIPEATRAVGGAAAVVATVDELRNLGINIGSI